MKKQKQKGIVLLSCLVFLLILTSLVKYTMSSAKMEELKSGADIDEISAKEAALLAIKDAEDFILRRSYGDKSENYKKYCLNNDNDKTTNNGSLLNCDVTTVKMDGKTAADFWLSKKNVWKNMVGVYDGNDPNNRCNDEGCQTIGTKTVDWYKKTENCDTDTTVICYGKYTNRKTLDEKRAKYILEVFLVGEDGVFKDIIVEDSKYDMSNDMTLVIRVTAVGYSQDIDTDTNFREGAIPNNSYAMYQASYIISGE